MIMVSPVFRRTYLRNVVVKVYRRSIVISYTVIHDGIWWIPVKKIEMVFPG